MKKTISIVVPVYNEEEGILSFLDQNLLPIVKNLTYKIELIIVNDGSRDNSIEQIKKSKLPVNLVCLTRNFGKEIALSAGIKEATGDAIILIDSDGQHPVEAIPQMIEKWEQGAYVVTAVRGQNTTSHRFGSKCYYWLMKQMGNNIVVGAMDFRLIDREVADEFNRFTEKKRLTRGLIDWLGFPQEYIKVKTKNRINGKPSYNPRKLAALTLDSLIANSRKPLMFFGLVGGFIMFFSFLLGLFILIQQYILGDPLHLGWSGAVAMSVFIAFLVGLVLLSQSLTALYISQIHAESKGRPLYIIDRRKSFKNHKK